MNHPGLDERLLVQWWSRVRCNRDAYAVSNLIDPNTGCEHSADYLDMMKLKGVLTRRGIAARRRAAFADEVPYPGDQNNGAFEDLEALLGGHQNLLFAPEGETNPWPSLKPLKSGIARVAMRCANRSCAKILIVPVAVHFIASGAYCRDAVLEFGEPICVLADTEDVWRCKLMDSVSKELRRMCDFVPYASNRLDPAPHHNGRSDMEKNNPALKSQLFDVDVVYSFSSAVQAYAINCKRLELPLHIRSALADIASVPSDDAVVWSVWQDLQKKYSFLHEAASKQPACSELMRANPVDFCRQIFSEKSENGTIGLKSNDLLYKSYSLFLDQSIYAYIMINDSKAAVVGAEEIYKEIYKNN